VFVALAIIDRHVEFHDVGLNRHEQDDGGAGGAEACHEVIASAVIANGLPYAVRCDGQKQRGLQAIQQVHDRLPPPSTPA